MSDKRSDDVGAGVASSEVDNADDCKDCRILVKVQQALTGEILFGPTSVQVKSTVASLYESVAGSVKRDTDSFKLIYGTEVLKIQGCLDAAGLESDDVTLLLVVKVDGPTRRLQMVEEGNGAGALADLKQEMQKHESSGRGRDRCNCELYNGKLCLVNRIYPRCTSPDDNPYGPCSACRSGPRVTGVNPIRCPQGGMLNKELKELQDRIGSRS
eukprot:TRINITY_DN11070_c0_g5_i1.p1 TRINITY_DN11070_c0_g5~~TRINITY_DN11070_c0_g5_i1.p1  ORF type:complete len:213 (+),score=24.95 TRINITY_DN11070_c0_g5_i1:77-715(+)